MKSKYTKATTIVGVSIILLAVFIFFISKSIIAKKENKVKEPAKQEQVTKEPPKQEQVVEEPKTPVVQEPVQVQEPPKTEVPKEEVVKEDGTRVIEISETSLGKPLRTNQEVMKIAKKTMYLVDKDIQTDLNKQLVYCIELLSTDGKTYNLYVNGSVYKGLSVGGTLTIDYDVYRNDEGVEFPVIINAQAQ